MKIYIVKAPQGEYESYQEPIVKVFIDKSKANLYIKEENSKLPVEQAKKCQNCYFKWENPAQKEKIRPTCFNGDEYCENYFKYNDVQPLFIEEYEVEE